MIPNATTEFLLAIPNMTTNYPLHMLTQESTRQEQLFIAYLYVLDLLRTMSLTVVVLYAVTILIHRFGVKREGLLRILNASIELMSTTIILSIILISFFAPRA